MLSSSNFNTHIRDNLISYGGADSTSTTPPASPGNGQRWVYVGSGYLWQFVYYTSSALWFFVGGPPATSENRTLSNTSSTSYVTPASGGVTVTVPRTGTYMAIAAAAGSYTSAQNMIALKRGSAATSDADVVCSTNDFTPAVRTFASISLTAGDSIIFQHRSVAAGSSNSMGLVLTVWPVSVT